MSKMPRLLLFTLLAMTAAGFGQTTEHFITIDGVQRRYLLHLPPQYGKAKPAPLIFMLHGGGGSPERTGTRDLSDFADPKGFIVVYPEGLTKGWNDGRIIRGRAQPDDVAFFSAMIDELVRAQNADPKRIYATGMSNGGFMSFRLACDLSDKIAAIAPVAGSVGVGLLPNCKPKRPVPVLMINGTDDPIVPFAGGAVARTHGRSYPVSQVVQFWRDFDGCGPVQKADVPDHDRGDRSTASYESCVGKDGSEVVNYTVDGGGHTWPGGPQYLPKFLVGRVNRDFNASEVIVEFFSRHALPDSPKTALLTLERVWCAGGRAHLVANGGSEKVIPPLKDQVDCESPQLSPDRRTAGWTALFDTCCQSYPIPLNVVVYRDGEGRSLSCNTMVWHWAFSDDGATVAIAAGPTHGVEQPVVYCRFDVATGKLLAEATDPPGGNELLPEWAVSLRAAWKKKQ
jgi:polyhydroxybutyrate depolymerase